MVHGSQPPPGLFGPPAAGEPHSSTIGATPNDAGDPAARQWVLVEWDLRFFPYATQWSLVPDNAPPLDSELCLYDPWAAQADDGGGGDGMPEDGTAHLCLVHTSYTPSDENNGGRMFGWQVPMEGALEWRFSTRVSSYVKSILLRQIHRGFTDAYGFFGVAYAQLQREGQEEDRLQLFRLTATPWSTVSRPSPRNLTAEELDPNNWERLNKEQRQRDAKANQSAADI